MSELKRCPFCGSKNIKVDSVEISCPQEIGSYAECLDCRVGVEVTKPYKVINAWNTRPIEDELNARIVQLEAERNKLAEAVGLMTTLKPTMVVDSAHPVEMALEVSEYIVQLTAELAALKSENVNLSKKVTDYGKELRQSYKYDKTCSTCRYLDENQNCVLGIRCVNYTLWQGKIL